MGELAFFREAVFERESDGVIRSVNETPGRIIGQKYPEAVRELCLEFCSQSEPYDASEVARIAASARLPRDKRVSLLREMIGELPLDRQAAVFRVFAEFDKGACAESLLPFLDELARDGEAEDSGGAEVELADVIYECDDLTAWRAYLRVARHCEVYRRGGIVEELRYHGDVSKGQLAFLAALLNDEAERDITPGPNEFRFPKEPFPIISVANLSAKVLAELLEIKPNPNSSWTVEQWSALRDQVRQRLAQEELPELE
jgi:hypothetical protein